ncbi:MAG: prepilin-type N-terminal cleavage/methylation domain-containing protein [Chlamydiae bacterium]|nr:prepilin-type N-terminal cleavage/methylation domain-containing protein [Chlamydiota bacterium]MBI3276963.1 prepilin-type N-terminal cleavage/methylation domain-containing protein [Chlamydiota bacterium]
MRRVVSFKSDTDSRGFAFTLVELMIVITVIALLALIPLSRGISSFQPPLAAQKLVSDIQYVQALAMSTSTRCGVDFNVGTNAYTLFSGTPSTPLTDPVNQGTYTVQYGTGVYSEVSLSSASIGSTSTLYFDSRGKPYNGSGTALTSDGLIVLNGAINVTVTRETGYTASS